jgi:hypothetical protein
MYTPQHEHSICNVRPKNMRSALTAFFSYSREDAEFALRLAKDLRAAGASVWLDQLDIKPGQRWDRAVEDALASCPLLLVLLSPTSVNSTNVMDEVSLALEEGKTVVPVVYRDCKVPFRLRRLQHVDFRLEYSTGLSRLLETFGVTEEIGFQQVQSEMAPAEPSGQEERERKAAADKGNVQPACIVMEDQRDEAWEAERQKRQNELSKAVFEGWLRHGAVHANTEDTEGIKSLRSALNDWLSKRPSGFEGRQLERQERQQAETRRAIDSWLQRTGE